eukprot:SAG11_NODE_6152_length_1375_cov_56.235110_2_plen_126_part_01
MSFHLCGSSGPFSVAGFELSISDSVTHADSALFFGFGSVGGVAAVGHFSETAHNISGRYGSIALPILTNQLPILVRDSSSRVCDCSSMSGSGCGPGPAINRLISVGPTATRRDCWDAPYFQDRSPS